MQSTAVCPQCKSHDLEPLGFMPNASASNEPGEAVKELIELKAATYQWKCKSCGNEFDSDPKK